MDAVPMLCVCLVHGAVSTLKMIRVCFPRAWHTTEAGNDLPQATSSTHVPEAIPRDDRCFASIPQDEGWLTALTPLVPTNVGVNAGANGAIWSG